MIPVSSKLLKPQIVRNVKKIIKSRAKFYHDRKCMKEKTFQPGEQIFVSVNGGTYFQNSYHIKPAHNQNYRQVLPDTSSSITSPNSSLSSKESLSPVNDNSHNNSTSDTMFYFLGSERFAGKNKNTLDFQSTN
jgi:hypothetical protein